MFALIVCLAALHQQALASHHRLPPGQHVGEVDGVAFSARLGVQFAKAPRRFQKAELNDEWMLDLMTVPPEQCPQSMVAFGTTEDCLRMNIYGPTHSQHMMLPVLVYIHGGAYKFGTANQFPPSDMGHLAMEGYVVVAIQYRVSALGFFYPARNSHRFTANIGLHDAHLALQFIQKNIKHFGGNPENVTLIGQSAGACTAHALALSPAVSPDLFKNVVLMSGVMETCYNSTFGATNPSAVVAKKLCEVNIHSEFSEDELYNCLMSKSATEIAMIDQMIPTNWLIYDDDFFLPDGYLKLNRESRGHRFLIGVTRDEWAFFEELFVMFNMTTYNSQRFATSLAAYAGITNRKEVELLTSFYTNEQSSSEDTEVVTLWYEAVVKALTDLVFHKLIVQEVERLLEPMNHSNILLYSFNVPAKRPSFNGKSHAAHTHELAYLFGPRETIAAHSTFRDAILGFANGLVVFANIMWCRITPFPPTRKSHARRALHFEAAHPTFRFKSSFCPRIDDLKKAYQDNGIFF